MRIKIATACDRRIPRKIILKLAELIIEEEDPPPAQVNIVFVTDRTMAALNRRYRGKTGPTDVLSFNIDLTPPFKRRPVLQETVLGEIYISADTASRNAERYNRSFTAEIIHLICHGLLHLLGYDHVRDKDYHGMQAREEYFLKKMDL